MPAPRQNAIALGNRPSGHHVFAAARRVGGIRTARRRDAREGLMPVQQIADCVFCAPPPDLIVAANELAFAVRDTSPVTSLHTLVLPRRHVASYFDLTSVEDSAIRQLLIELQANITRLDRHVEGFNVGINVGEVAGQTIFHCHLHLIPRRSGDVPDPRGGVRAVIPGKANY
jgi:ATP adenylyltransferase